MFHIDLLTPYRETPFHGKNYQCPLAELVQGQEEYKVEAVLDKRHYGRKKKRQYLVKWKGYLDSDNEWVDHEDMHALEAIKEYEETRKDKRRLRSRLNRSNTPMSSSPISILSTFSAHLDILDALVAAPTSDLAKVRAAFPTPEPGQLSPDSTFSVDVDLSPTMRVDAIGVEAEVGHMEGGAGAENTGGAAEILYRQRWVATAHAARTSWMRAPALAEDTTARGCLRRPVRFGTPSAHATLMARDASSARALSRTADATPSPLTGPKYFVRSKESWEAARGMRLPPQEPHAVLSAQQQQHFIQLADSNSTVNGEEGEEVPPATRALGRQGGQQNRRRRPTNDYRSAQRSVKASSQSPRFMAASPVHRPCVRVSLGLLGQCTPELYLHSCATPGGGHTSAVRYGQVLPRPRRLGHHGPQLQGLRATNPRCAAPHPLGSHPLRPKRPATPHITVPGARLGQQCTCR